MSTIDPNLKQSISHQRSWLETWAFVTAIAMAPWVALSQSSKPSVAPAHQTPDASAATEATLPIPVKRGKLRVDTQFNTQADIAKWRLGKGLWTVENGVLKGVEKPEDKHAAGLACQLVYHDAAIQFRVRLASNRSGVLLLRNKFGNLCRVIISPDGITLQKDKPNAPKDTPEKTEVLAKARCQLVPDRWYQVSVVVSGREFAVVVDGQPILKGAHNAIDVDKTEVEFMASGDAILFDDLRVWDAEKL